MSRFEDEKVARLASTLEDAENALYCPSPHEAQVPLAERNKAVEKAQEALTRYLNTLATA